MADRKNQHFVPRTLLKPWTLECSGKAINLFNIRLKNGIQNAPVKNQCSKNYFYGKDMRLEKFLGVVEGIFSEIIRGLPTANNLELGQHLSILREFCFLQHLRTERSLAEEAVMLREMYDRIFHKALPEGHNVPTHERIVEESMQRWHETVKYTIDLKGVFILNNSNTPFIISDDPAIHTNKFHIRRLRSTNFGIQNSGMILTMPLSPRMAVMFYDGDVYTVPDKNGFKLTMSSDADVKALNELQYLKANANIYFADWNKLEIIREEFCDIVERRLPVHFRLNLLVPVEGKEGVFKMADDQSANPAGRSMIHIESVSFQPRSWPSQLRFRSKMFGYSDGSSAGLLRHQWAIEAGMDKRNKVKL